MEKSGFISAGDSSIFYCRSGEGKPLIMLHGNGEDHSVFEKQVSFFSNKYSVITIDCRGHGKSSFGKKPLNFDTMAADVIAVMDHLNVDKAHVLGFSDGGNTAIHMALHYPARLNSIILSGANIFPAGLKLYVRITNILYYSICSMFAPVNKKMRRKKQIIGLMVNYPRLTSDNISNIKTPALVIAGWNDMIKHRHTVMIAEAMKNAQLCIIKGGDHFALYKMPEVFNQIVDDFLGNH